MQRNASEAERMSDINMIDSITSSLTERFPKRDASIRFTLMPVQRAKLSVSHHGSSWSGMSNPFLVVKVATSWWEKCCKFFTSNSSIARSVEDVERMFQIQKYNRFETFVSLNDGISLLLGTFFAKVRYAILGLILGRPNLYFPLT